MSSWWSLLVAIIKAVEIPFVAASGGILVLIGLWLEEHGELETYRDIAHFRKSRCKSKRGREILIFGIVVEIIVAIGLAVRDGVQMANIKMETDPQNANISDMSATAILFVKETHFDELTNWNTHRVADITLCHNGDITRSKFDTLNAYNFTKNDFVTLIGGTAGDREYGIRFRSFNFRAFAGQEMKVRAIDGVRVMRMDLNFLPHGAVITAGGVELVVNSVHKMFLIHPQIDTNPPDGTPGFPYIVLATNADKLP